MRLFGQNLVKMSATSPTGTAGSYTVGSASSGFVAHNLSDGETSIFEFDDGGTNREVFRGTYTASGTTVSRDLCLGSTNSGSFISWGSGTSGILRIVGTGETNQWGHPGYVTGLDYHNPLAISQGGTSYAHGLAAASRLFCQWFPIFEPIKPVSIALYLATNGSSGALARLGAYDAYKGRCGNLLVDAGTVALDTGAAAIKKATVTNVWFLPPGIFLVVAFNSVTTMPDVRFFNPGYQGLGWHGITTASDTYTVTKTNVLANDSVDYSGGLPSSATMKSATFTNSLAQSQDPVLWLGM